MVNRILHITTTMFLALFVVAGFGLVRAMLMVGYCERDDKSDEYNCLCIGAPLAGGCLGVVVFLELIVLIIMLAAAGIVVGACSSCIYLCRRED